MKCENENCKNEIDIDGKGTNLFWTREGLSVCSDCIKIHLDKNGE